jgi:hypothetical protein
MSANHGTHSRYSQGCRCGDCREGHRLKAREYAQRKAAGQTPVAPFQNRKPDLEPGPVESGVQAEIGDLADARPGLTQIALSLARLMDDPKAKNQQPAAAKVLVTVLEKLHSASARGRRGHLALVRTMTEKG